MSCLRRPVSRTQRQVPIGRFPARRIGGFPYLTTPELVAAYNANQNPSHPRSGRVIGTLWPQYAGEPDTCPPRRLPINNTPGGATYGFQRLTVGGDDASHFVHFRKYQKTGFGIEPGSTVS